LSVKPNRLDPRERFDRAGKTIAVGPRFVVMCRSDEDMPAVVITSPVSPQAPVELDASCSPPCGRKLISRMPLCSGTAR